MDAQLARPGRLSTTGLPAALRVTDPLAQRWGLRPLAVGGGRALVAPLGLGPVAAAAYASGGLRGLAKGTRKWWAQLARLEGRWYGRMGKSELGVDVSAHFSKDMTVEQAFKVHAGARRVFAKFHLGGCSNCAISETETVEQVSEGYGIPLPMLMDELEKLFSQAALSVGDKVRLPDEIRTKIPQLASVPEIGEIKSHETGAYTAEFGEVRLQGLADDFIRVEPANASAS
jgi:hypothetical protein